MIDIIERVITDNERVKMLSDYDQIFMEAGISQNEFKRYSLVVEEEKQMIGYVSGIKDHQWLFLSDMWIEATHRRQGIGSHLLNCFEEKIKADGIQHVYLWTYGPINPKFYEKNGYCHFTVFENFYEVNGYHQYGYRKDL